MENLELRMYFFVPYQLTGIQKGIQCGHAALNYANRYHDTPLFQEFINNHKTWIILNGGTTNNGHNTESRKGDLNQLYKSILMFNITSTLDQKIDVENFYEPDLNDTLTSVCFICDERVFNKELYPDFKDWVFKNTTLSTDMFVYHKFINQDNLIDTYPKSYREWYKLIGGEKNIFLRTIIDGKKLA